MARLAVVLALASCGDNTGPPAMCDGVEMVFAEAVPLHAIVRALPSRGLVLAGTFRDPFVLGEQTFTSAGGTDIFVARIAADGRVTAATYGDAEDQELRELATNGHGDFAIAGRFRGSLDLGGGPLLATGTSSMYVAQFTAGGALRFSNAYPVEAILRSLALSATGDVAIAGTNFDPVDFGGGVLPTSVQFFGVLDARGAHVTSRSLAAEDLSVNLDVGVTFDRDELLVAGSFTRAIDLGGGPLASAGELDFYLARLARDGTHRTSRRFGGAGNDGYVGFDGDRVTIAPVAGGVVLASGIQPALDDVDDVFITNLDTTFAPVWNRTFAYPDYQAVGDLVVATDGTIAITGISAGATLAGSPGACGTAEASHAFATTFDPDGHVRWSRCFPAEFAAGLSIAFRDPSELVVAGTFSGAIDIGTTRLTSETLSGFVAAVRPTCIK